jgi:anthranilate synthase component 1
MIHPSLEQFSQAAQQFNVIPVFVEVPADLETPLSVYLKLKQSGPSFLLESVQQGESVGRYSFVGIGPRWLLRLDGKQLRHWEPGGNEAPPAVEELEGDAFGALEKLLSGFRPAEIEGLPRFWGGAVGYFGYDAVREIEPILDLPQAHPSELPRACFVYSRTSVLFDHVRQRMFVVVAAVLTGSHQAELAYSQAVAELRGIQETLRRPLVQPNSGQNWGEQPPCADKPSEKLHLHTSQADFCKSVLKAKEYIAAGDIFQVVLSQRVSLESPSDAVSLYRALRLKNPSPYMLLLDFEDFQIIGASPEMLVKLEGDKASYRPLAGTRRRAAGLIEDLALEKELLADPKERAEHVMLVDLGRNDLGRVCRYGSVQVPQFMEVERYSHVMHIVSLVEGQLREDATGLQLLRACFPAGTVSGAPKVRAMQIIEELEPFSRGPYAGTVGTFSFGGDINTCITIRTMWRVGGRLFLQAGAGIVADSDPELEYRETLAKLEGLLSAVDLAQAEFLPQVARSEELV